MPAKRKVFAALKIAIAFALLAWLAKSGRLDLGILASAKSNWPWFMAAQGVFGLVQYMTAVRWRWLLGIVGIECTTMKAFRLTIAGLLFNQVLIGSTGGDVYRVMAFETARTGQKINIAASVAADRLVGLYATVALIPISLIWTYSLVIENVVLSLIVFGSIAATIILPILFWVTYRWRSKGRQKSSEMLAETRLARWLGYFDSGFALIPDNLGIILKAILLSLAIQALIVTVNIFLAFSILGPDIDWEMFFLLIPIALLGMAIPINPPGALGTGEAMYAYLLELAAVTQGGVISLLHRLTNILWALPGALAFSVPVRDGAMRQKPTDTDDNPFGNGSR